MKLLFLINSLEGGGAERVISTLSHYFVLEKKYQVAIVTLHKANAQYDLPPSVSVQSPKSGVFCVGLGKILFIPLVALEFSQILRKEKPDGVISFLPRSNFVHLMTRWLGNKSKIVLSERADTKAVYASKSLPDRAMRTLIRLSYPLADSIIAISEGVKNSLVGLGVPTEKITVIYNPQQIEYIKLKSRESADALEPGKCVTLITIGRLVYQKDHQTLLEAFKKIRAAMDARLIIIGEGPYEARLKKRAETLGIAEWVSWLPWQSNPFAILARANLFLFTSRFEGFGNVLIEAMVCGLPIVSTDCPSGPREILKDGEYGVLVSIGDSTAIAQAAIRLLKNKQLYEKMRQGGFERAQDFDVHSIAPQYLNVLGLRE